MYGEIFQRPGFSFFWLRTLLRLGVLGHYPKLGELLQASTKLFQRFQQSEIVPH